MTLVVKREGELARVNLQPIPYECFSTSICNRHEVLRGVNGMQGINELIQHNQSAKVQP